MRLYEFECEKIFYNNQESKIFRYQIPASNELEAHFVLGQAFNKIDEYALIIHSWSKVQ